MTKLELYKVKIMWGNVNFDYAFSSARGRSGGMLSVWDNSVCVKRHISGLNNFVVVEGEWVILGLNCFMVNVYAPQDEMEKRVLWQSLLSFINNNPGHYFIMGDFNAARFEHERMGTTFSNRVARYFNDFISEASLTDIPLGSFYFTRVDATGKKLSKLDRFLLSVDLISRLPNFEAIALELSIAYHCLILLRQNKLVDMGAGSDELLNEMRSILKEKRKLEHVKMLDESQKAKVKWYMEADENSKFFHAIINQKRRQLSIRGKKKRWGVD
ncbi:uncharacterized protein LOC143561587 [Bidens hawaiensis]|uniref:uncharacterized protein LOC143561587 n=1 Tax=Bidens hawaiensis TaxID=980011 RepID=UPI00404A2771